MYLVIGFVIQGSVVQVLPIEWLVQDQEEAFSVVWNAHLVINSVSQHEDAHKNKQTNKFKCSSKKPLASLWIEWMVQDQEEAFYVAWNAHHVINPDDLLHLREETFLLFFSSVNPITGFENVTIKLQ